MHNFKTDMLFYINLNNLVLLFISDSKYSKISNYLHKSITNTRINIKKLIN